MGGVASAVASVAKSSVAKSFLPVLPSILYSILNPPRKPKDITFVPPPPPPPSSSPSPTPAPPLPSPPPPPPPSIEEIIHKARNTLGMDVVNHYNFAFVGRTGVGKSSLINGLRLIRDNQPGAAKVGEVETTMEIGRYTFPGYPHVVLWDLPGAGTLKHPESSYFDDKMLYAFDCLLIVSSDRFYNFDYQLAEKAIKYKTPFAFVRTKADVSLKSLAYREGKTMQEAAPVFRKIVEQNFRDGIQKVQSLKASRELYMLFIVSAWAFDKKRRPYALFDADTGEVDDSLRLMDEEQLIHFVAKSIKYRGI